MRELTEKEQLVVDKLRDAGMEEEYAKEWIIEIVDEAIEREVEAVLWERK